MGFKGLACFHPLSKTCLSLPEEGHGGEQTRIAANLPHKPASHFTFQFLICRPYVSRVWMHHLKSKKFFHILSPTMYVLKATAMKSLHKSFPAQCANKESAVWTSRQEHHKFPAPQQSFRIEKHWRFKWNKRQRREMRVRESYRNHHARQTVFQHLHSILLPLGLIGSTASQAVRSGTL